MKSYPWLLIAIAAIIGELFAVSSHAQRITQLSPPQINLWGVSIADFSHVMFVGDSATVLIGNQAGLYPRYYYHPQFPPPCDKSHTFYGVSYYDTLHAAIVGDNGLIFTTSDEGNSWVQSGEGITSQTLRAITHTTKGGSAGSLIVVGDSGIILLSTNQGTNWSRVPSNTTDDIHAIAINTNGSGFFVGEHGLIGRTTNSGVSWPYVTDTMRNLYGNSNFINFRVVSTDNNPAEIAVAAGDSGAMAWESGNHWTAVFDTAAPDSASKETIRHANYRAINYDGYATETWNIGDDGDFNITMTVISSGPTNLGYSTNTLFGDADGGIDQYETRYTCAENWFGKPGNLSIVASPGEGIGTNSEGDIVSPEYLTSYEDFLFLSIDTLGTGFASCAGGYFMKTTDNGMTWAWAYPLPDTMSTVWKVTDIHTIDSNNAFAVGWDGGLFRTSDGGAYWSETNIAAANQERLRGIGHPDGEAYLACGDFGTIIRSTDNGSTWNASTTPTTNYLEAIAFSSSDTGIAAGENGTIVRTTDQGLTWTNINNPLTGTDYSFRAIQAFPSGTYYATTDSAGLWRSTDQGQNWQQVPNVSQTLGEGFYSDKIGVIGESAWSSQTVPDTMRFAFSRDGFATKTEFNVPFINNSRVRFHFLDSNTFICYGSASYVVKVDMSQGGASVTDLSAPQTSPIQAFPNPSNTHSITVEYDLDNSGATTIELWNALGEKVQTLQAGNEIAGHHTQQLKIDPELHGSFYIKVISGSETKVLPIRVE